jgi:hypothetical protein
MAQILTKGDSVYECDVCTRRVRVPRNDKGLNVIQRCVITANCKGKLHPILTTQEINSTPAFPPEVVGVQDWSQRQILYTHNQTIRTATWIVNHNLSNKPVVEVFVNRSVAGSADIQVKVTPQSIVTINDNTLEIIFDQAESGIAQCIALASKNTTNPAAIGTIVASDVQITNSGDMTLAVLATLSTSNITAIINSPSQTQPVTLEYQLTSTEGQGGLQSPWTGDSGSVIIGGKTYNLRRFNFLTTTPGPSYFPTGIVSNGSTIYFQNIGGPGQILVLMANTPFAIADRVYDKYVDTKTISSIVPQLYYNNGNVFAKPSVIKSTYPPIIVVP